VKRSKAWMRAIHLRMANYNLGYCQAIIDLAPATEEMKPIFHGIMGRAKFHIDRHSHLSGIREERS